MKRIICTLFLPVCFAITVQSGFAQSGTITTYAGNGTFDFSGDGGLATSAAVYPTGIAVDAAGNLFIADYYNSRVRKVTPGGVISTVAGNGNFEFSGDGGPATSAALSPLSVAVDKAGNLFIGDYDNNRVLEVTLDGVIRTVAGNGTYGFSGDGGPATSAALNYPISIAVDAAGNLFIADSESSRIREVTPDGTIRTIAGTGGTRFSGDGGPAISAQIGYPSAIAVDAAGNLFIADGNNSRIRKVDANGLISTVAGNGGFSFAGDGGPATSAQFGYPIGMAVDAAGNLFLDDYNNQRIRRITPGGLISTVAGNGVAGFSGDGAVARSARLNYPEGVAVDAAGNLFIADSENNRVRKVDHRSRLDFNGGHDFNGDGKSDVLFRDSAGNLSVWLLNGYAVTQSSLIANIWTGWTVVGTGDFNGDGKADILWRDVAGNVVTWLMDGASIVSFSDPISLPTAWTVAGVADFNGDGKSDILWRDAGGEVAIWLMNGHSIAFFKSIGNIWTGWKIAGTGDFNGDGKSDILWQDTGGNVAIWLMDGTTVSSYGSLNNPILWTVAGVADFDGDGAADIVWRDTAGHVALWLMNGISIASNWNIGNIPTEWTIVGTGDFNGDIRADIVWRDAAGNVAIWLMDGPDTRSYSSMGNVSDRMVQ